MKNDTNYLLNMSTKSAVFLVATLLMFCFGLSYCGSAFENQEMPANDPCSSTFLILDFKNRAIVTFVDCEDGGTIEVDAQVPCFNSNTVNRILQTARKSNAPGQTNSVWVQHDKHVLCITRNGSRKELTDTIVSIIQNFKEKNPPKN